MNELALIFKNDVAYADSRDIAAYFGKRHRDVLRDIRNLMKAIGEGERKFAHSYINAQGKEQPCYQLDFDTTITLITGYDVKLRSAIVKQWHKLINERAKERIYSKGIRHDFTETLKTHGYDKQHEYIQTSMQMKKPLGITARKKDMTKAEIQKITAAEYLAEAMLSDEYGYHEVNPVCVEASAEIDRILSRKRITA